MQKKKINGKIIPIDLPINYFDIPATLHGTIPSLANTWLKGTL